MHIAIVGTGYVGLVTGACLADGGHHVTCLDVIPAKIEALRRGNLPIHEPGLDAVVQRAVQAGRLTFTTGAAEAVRQAEAVFLAVGTPQADDGAADLIYIWNAADSLAPHLSPSGVVIIKSTVPVGTNRRVAERLRERTGRTVDIVSNPEFLREGQAVRDFQHPDRVVIGGDRPDAVETVRRIYTAFLPQTVPIVTMGLESAEMTKYVANCFLATKISFINEMANLCERVGANIQDVREGIKHDARIGERFLYPGVGYGGSCFPKDVRALHHLAEEHLLAARILTAVDDVNSAQKFVLFDKLRRHFGGHLKGRTIAVWGLAFKPDTDDVREAPALVLIRQLLAAGASVRAFDPVAMPAVKVQAEFKNVAFCDSALSAAREADALALVTEWKEFRDIPAAELKAAMRSPAVFDGRNALDAHTLRAQGFAYTGIGVV